MQPPAKLTAGALALVGLGFLLAAGWLTVGWRQAGEPIHGPRSGKDPVSVVWGAAYVLGAALFGVVFLVRAVRAWRGPVSEGEEFPRQGR